MAITPIIGKTFFAASLKNSLRGFNPLKLFFFIFVHFCYLVDKSLQVRLHPPTHVPLHVFKQVSLQVPSQKI